MAVVDAGGTIVTAAVAAVDAGAAVVIVVVLPGCCTVAGAISVDGCTIDVAATGTGSACTGG